MRPNVSIALTNGNLNIQAPSELGTSGVLIASPVAPVAGYGAWFLISTIDQANTALAQVGNEAVLAAIVNGFFSEAPEGTKLYVLCMAQTTTLAVLFAAVNAEKILYAATGSLRMIAAIKFPANTYSATITNGFDADVHSAVMAAQTLADAWFTKMQPFRFFIEGYAFTIAADAKDYSTEAYRNGGIIVGNIDGSTAQATLLAMGRAAATAPQQNLGRIKTGSLNITQESVVSIGATVVDSVTDSDKELLYSKRYISFEKNQIASGYVFSDDVMLTAVTDDYNNLAYGRVIDNATRVAFSTYYLEEKDDVDVDDGGRLGTLAEKALENDIKDAINQQMAGQLSTNKDGTLAVRCLVNPDPAYYAALYSKNNITAPNFNLLQTGKVYLFLQLRPKGCLKYLTVYLGFTN